MKLIILGLLLCISTQCFSAPFILDCTLFSVNDEERNPANSIRASIRVDLLNKAVRYLDWTEDKPLLETEEKLSWNYTLPNRDKLELTMVENVNRSTGEYSSWLIGPKGIVPFSVGSCEKAATKF